MSSSVFVTKKVHLRHTVRTESNAMEIGLFLAFTLLPNSEEILRKTARTSKKKRKRRCIGTKEINCLWFQEYFYAGTELCEVEERKRFLPLLFPPPQLFPA